MRDSRPIYECQGLVKRRAGSAASFELQVPRLLIQAGEIIILRGQSGCGKSTLLDLLALALRPDAAEEFSFHPAPDSHADIRSLWESRNRDGLGRLRGAHIGYVLQTGGLLSFLTARENIALPCRLLGRDPKEAVDGLARRLGILEQLEKHPRQLSVGERQRVAIARAMAHRPSVVLADEPTASVDPLNARAILEMFLGLVRHTAVSAVIATHDWRPETVPGVQMLNHRIERDGKTTRSLFWN